MVETKGIEELELNKYEISETHMDKINGLMEEKRFKNIDSFVNQAIEVFLAWEYNPPLTMVEMSKVRPTIPQYAFMISMGIPLAQLKETYPNYPERFGDSWDEYLANNETIDHMFQKIKSQHDPQSDARASHKDYDQALARRTDAINQINSFDFEEGLENDELEYNYDGYPLLFTHYSRLFPAKVGVLALAELMRQNNDKLIHFDEFTKKAYDLCEEISEKQTSRQVLKLKQKKEKTSRESDKTTGLPKPYDKNKTDDEQVRYQNRYKERFFGKVKRHKKDAKYYFEGLMSALDLIRIFKIDDEYVVTFTEKGKKFCEEKNPIFDREFLSDSFYLEEKQMILRDLLEGKQLEVDLMKTALNTINNCDENISKDLTIPLDNAFEITIEEYCNSNKDSLHLERLQDILDSTKKIKKDKIELTKLFEVESNPTKKIQIKKDMKKQSPIEAIRVATMGRMAELNLVIWEIENGKSSYKPGESELIEFLNTKHESKLKDQLSNLKKDH